MHDKYINQHSKHLLGSHMHGLVHKHKPGGTHPISEGHLPVVGNKQGKTKGTEKRA